MNNTNLINTIKDNISDKYNIEELTKYIGLNDTPRFWCII